MCTTNLHLPGFASSESASSVVEPPAATSENVAAGGSLSAKTFGAFTDADSVIASYSATTTNTSGSTAWSGTGLGPYTPSGAADGSSGVLELDALNGDGDVVATAVHAYSIDAAAGAASFVSARNVALSTAANDGPHTTGSHTATDGDGDSIGYEVDRIGGSNTGTVEIVNGEGAVIDGSGAGAVAAGWDVGAVLDGESVDRAGEGVRVVHVTLTDIDLTSDLILGFNTTNATSGGNFRGVRITASGAGYEVKTRANTSDGAVFASGASIPSSMVVTCTIYDAHSCRYVITEGGTAPADVYTSSASPGVASRSPQTDGDYDTDMLVVVGAVANAAVTVSDIDIGDIQ